MLDGFMYCYLTLTILFKIVGVDKWFYRPVLNTNKLIQHKSFVWTHLNSFHYSKRYSHGIWLNDVYFSTCPLAPHILLPSVLHCLDPMCKKCNHPQIWFWLRNFSWSGLVWFYGISTIVGYCYTGTCRPNKLWRNQGHLASMP